VKGRHRVERRGQDNRIRRKDAMETNPVMQWLLVSFLALMLSAWWKRLAK